MQLSVGRSVGMSVCRPSLILPLIEILKFDWLRQILYAAILCFLTNLIFLRALSISTAKPVPPALPLLPLMESTSTAGDFGNVTKHCQCCRRRGRRGDVNGKHPNIPPPRDLLTTYYFSQPFPRDFTRNLHYDVTQL